MKHELEPGFRARLGTWADRPPARAAAAVAARARAEAGVATSRRALPRWSWAAAALLILAGGLALARRADAPVRAAAPLRARVAPANAAAPARLVVLELRSGSTLYVDLAAGRRTS